MRLHISQNLAVSWILVWVLLIAISSAKLVVRACRNAQVILGTLNWLGLFSILVSDILHSNYRRLIVLDPFRFFGESEEGVGVCMCKLWKVEGGHRESRFMLSSTRFAPHTPNFLGALSKTHGEPQTRPVCAVFPLTIEGVLLPVVAASARFRSLDRRAGHCTHCGVGWTAGRG